MDTQSFSRGRFVPRLALAAVAAGALVCGVVAGEKPAAAQVVYVAPPAVEVDAYPTYPGYYWTSGYYGYGYHRPYWYGHSGRYYGHRHWWHDGRGWRHWHR
jgi:hypothetical protein